MQFNLNFLDALNSVVVKANLGPLFLIYGLAALPIGALFGFVLYRVFRYSALFVAQNEAEEILSTAKENLENLEQDLKVQKQELETELWEKEQKFFNQVEEKIEELEDLIKEKEEKLAKKLNQAHEQTKQFEEQVKKLESLNATHEANLGTKKQSIVKLKEDLIGKILSKQNLQKRDLISTMSSQLQSESEKHSAIIANEYVDYVKGHSEVLAKEILMRGLNRFHRPYCPERGIPAVYFENDQQREVLCDPDGENLKLLSSLTGCDLFAEKDNPLLVVLGFDPVRRELTRRVLERCLKEKKKVTKDFIQKTHDFIRKELLNTIKRDGDLIAKELKLDNLHPEIRQVMGSLRYRYSFTQNQYFHCGEVGWLCGILAQELGVLNYKTARRAGMLHDIGKAMDHEFDGGHAVIGANFIESRNESAEVVHAVRAHHYDEQPQNEIDFLVIAADAISGARPGARRSTVETYTQKITELESIAKSFNGVTDCFVLNGGRELRVNVNGKILSDYDALKVGKEMTQRIENECNYPGQIKVVVVRETFLTEQTRVH